MCVLGAWSSRRTEVYRSPVTSARYRPQRNQPHQLRQELRLSESVLTMGPLLFIQRGQHRDATSPTPSGPFSE